MALPCPGWGLQIMQESEDTAKEQVQASAPELEFEPAPEPTMEITIVEYFRLKRLADAYSSLGGQIKKLEQPS